MKIKLIKIFGSLCLSVLLAYASVAWAFDECLQHGEEHSNEQAVDGRFNSSGLLEVSTRTSDEPVRTIHCVETFTAFDMIASSFESLRQSFKDLSSTSYFADNLSAPGEVDALKGRSHPSWIGSSVASRHRPRYLLLSVFQV
jgi:hypothetical protein